MVVAEETRGGQPCSLQHAPRIWRLGTPVSAQAADGAREQFVKNRSWLGAARV